MSNSNHTGHAYGALPDREKRYVGVAVLTTADGLVTPLEILWDDGRRFKVDKVTGRKQAHSIKTGGTGMRYSVQIAGHDTFLWYDDYRKRWFVEAKRVPDTADWGC